MQEKGKVTFTLDGERLVGGEDMVPLPSWADLLEGCCGQDADTASEFLDRYSLPPTPATPYMPLTYLYHLLDSAGTVHPRLFPHCSSRVGG